MMTRALFVLPCLVALLLVDCAPSGSASPSATPPTTATPQQESPPPSLAPTPVATPRQPAMISYQLVGEATSFELSITAGGELTLSYFLSGQHCVQTTLLTAQQLSDLLAQFERADFFDLAPAYTVADPPGVIGEHDHRTLSYSLEHPAPRSRSVKTVGVAASPAELVKLQESLDALASSLRSDDEMASVC